MLVPIVLFAAAAGGGAVLAYLRLKDKPLPMGLALAHGAIAAAGLVALLVPVLSGEAEGGAAPLGLFVVAALGGFFLFSFHVRKKPIPVLPMVAHAGIALVAFLLLAARFLG